MSDIVISVTQVVADKFSLLRFRRSVLQSGNRGEKKKRTGRRPRNEGRSRVFGSAFFPPRVLFADESDNRGWTKDARCCRYSIRSARLSVEALRREAELDCA